MGKAHPDSAFVGSDQDHGLARGQAGAHDLPVIFDKAGRMFEIEKPKTWTEQ